MMASKKSASVCARRERGVVHHGVEPAKSVERRAHELRRTRRIGEIARMEDRAFSAEFGRKRAAARGVAAVQRDFCALARKHPRHRRADAGGAAGDEDDLFRESHSLRRMNGEKERRF
jgi:hypothetical protein